MSDRVWLTGAEVARIEPYFLKSYGKSRVSERSGPSSIIFTDRDGLRWCDSPGEFGPHKILHAVRRAEASKACSPVYRNGLAAESAEQATAINDAAYLKAHRTASILRVRKAGRGHIIVGRKME